MRLAFAITAALALAAGALPAQGVRVSGTVVDERRLPVQGAVVRVTGSDTTMTTGSSGTFSVMAVPGRIVLTVVARGYDFRSLPIEVYRDTILTITMAERIVTLDPMVVRPRPIRIRGTILDAATNEPVLFAQVALYPEGRFVEASNIGKFSLDKVAAGPVILVVEAMEHLPLVVEVNATRDTTIQLRMAVDSVALRIMAAQAIRLQNRVEAEPYVIRAWNADLIARERRSTVGELIDRIMVAPYDPRRRMEATADDACVFFDDRKIAPGMLDGMYPELIGRVEIVNRDMIRVYSKKYLMSLAATPTLRKFTYMPVGVRKVCE